MSKRLDRLRSAAISSDSTELVFAGASRTRAPLRWALAVFAVLALSATVLQLPPGALSNQLALQFETGSDDLRGGYNNVDVVLLRESGPPLWFRNVNAHHGFERHSSYTVFCTLPLFITQSDIVGVRLEMTSRGTTSSESWNLNGLQVSAHINDTDRPLANAFGNPWVRITSERPNVEVPFAPRPGHTAPAAGGRAGLGEPGHRGDRGTTLAGADLEFERRGAAALRTAPERVRAVTPGAGG